MPRPLYCKIYLSVLFTDIILMKVRALGEAKENEGFNASIRATMLATEK